MLIMLSLIVASIIPAISNVPAISTVSASAGDSIGEVDYGDLMQYEWPIWKGSERWDHFSAGPAPNSPDLKWIIDAPGARGGRYYPAAFNGFVFIYQGSTMRAYDGITGNLAWSKTYASSVGGPAKLDYDHMIAGSHCINPNNGDLIWTATPTPSPRTGISYTFQTRPDFRSMGGYSSKYEMYCSGGLGWNFSNPSQPPKLQWDISNTLFGNWEFESFGTTNNGTGVVLYRGDTVVYGINVETGDVLWEAQTSAGYYAYQGTYYEGAFYKGLIDGSFWAINATDGSIMWSRPQLVWYTAYACSSVAGYGMVYELRADGELHAFNAKTGEIVWTYSSDWFYYPGGPVIADGKIFLTAPDGGIDPYTGEESGTRYVCLDAFTGKLIWSIENLQSGSSGGEPTMIAYGNLYIIGENDKLRCYSGEAEDWPMYRHDPQISGIGSAGPNQLSERWRFQTGGQILSSPSIVGGSVYFGSYDKNLYCVDSLTGEKIWSFATNTHIGWSPAVVGGRVYTGADDGNVYCLNATNGALIWEKTVTVFAPANLSARFSYETPSPIVSGDKLYIGGVDGKLYCLRTSDGTELWSFDTSPGQKQAFITNMKKTGSLDDDGTIWTAGTPSSNAEKYQVYQLDATTGRLLFQIRIPYIPVFPITFAVFSAPLVVDDRLYICDANVHWYCFNKTTGEEIWRSERSRYSSQQTLIATYFEGSLLICDGFDLMRVNATTGEEDWRAYLKRELFGQPTLVTYGNTGLEVDRSNAKIYIGNNQGFISVLNWTDGSRISWGVTGSFTKTGMTVYDNRLYAGSSDFYLYCYEEANPTPPLTLSIEIAASAAQIDLGNSVSVTGSIFPIIPDLPVQINFIGPDNSVTDVPVTYDATTGAFSVTYTPTTVGQFSIVGSTVENVHANIATSWSSEEILNVNAAPSPTPTPTPTPILSTEVIYAIVAIVIIAIVAVVVFFFLKRKK